MKSFLLAKWQVYINKTQENSKGGILSENNERKNYEETIKRRTFFDDGYDVFSNACCVGIC